MVSTSNYSCSFAGRKCRFEYAATKPADKRADIHEMRQRERRQWQRWEDEYEERDDSYYWHLAAMNDKADIEWRNRESVCGDPAWGQLCCTWCLDK